MILSLKDSMSAVPKCQRPSPIITPNANVIFPLLSFSQSSDRRNEAYRLGRIDPRILGTVNYRVTLGLQDSILIQLYQYA